MIASSLIRTLWWASYFSLIPRKMEMALSVSGSSTITFWKRLSRALSFSKYFWNSSNVVAPMARSSPLASAGLRILAASIAPSPPPAPTSVCISSINSNILPSLFTTSLTTVLRRSSNSPLYLAPAINAPMSRAKICFSLRLSGTSPSIMRWASPSAMAVFPVPASPTSIGLFLVLREMICNKRRISSSLPMTGSNLPSCANWLRFFAYLPKALYWSSADAEIIFSPFCNSATESSIFFWVIPWSLRILPIVPLLTKIDISRCWVATNSSLEDFEILTALINVLEASFENNMSPPVTFGSLFKALFVRFSSNE